MTIVYDVEVSNEFLTELISILDHINFQLNNHSSAVKLYNEINKTIDNLTTYPLRFQTIKESIRRVKIKNYSIYYSVDEQLRIVNILHILYQGMDISQIALG